MPTERFEIHVEQAVLDDLRMRLRRTRWTEVTPEKGHWKSGTDPAYLRELVGYWQAGFDWRRQESKLNELPQFRARLGGAQLHFVHLQGRSPHPTPLLLLHGWPDSFYRFHKLLPILGDAFDLIVPSLPGFAFTVPVRSVEDDRPNRHSAELLWRLMTEGLGYQRFAVAGGDGGSVLAQILAIEHPDAVLGIHLTDLGWHAVNVDPATGPIGSKVEQKYLEAVKKQSMADGAYALVQMKQPRTLAAGLVDSPVGLASWIVDRFHAWSAGDLDRLFGKDDLLTNIMLYWVTGTIGSSMFNYYAEARSPSLTTADRVEQPVGLALFPKEPGGIPPRSLAERTLNVRRWTEMPRGGHFAALEEPQLLARDLVEFFDSLGAVQARLKPGRGAHVTPTI
jgi:pimeloyl-ACP methyl ester carboxylesterase